MSRIAWAALVVLALWGAIVWLRRRRERLRDDPITGRIVRAGAGEPRRPDDEIDYAALEEAERDVRDMESDFKGRPREDAAGDDWGPGTPKPPYL